jgi:hypothetical protein
MADVGARDAAAAALLAEREELARAITDALYAELPELLQKYGEAGRLKCLQDMRYNVEHLAPAVALGEPVLFGRYVAWVGDMLAARGVAGPELRRSLEIMRDLTTARLPAEQAGPVAESIAAGLAALATRAA